jgi:hypothetical protein
VKQGQGVRRLEKYTISLHPTAYPQILLSLLSIAQCIWQIVTFYAYCNLHPSMHISKKFLTLQNICIILWSPEVV